MSGRGAGGHRDRRAPGGTGAVPPRAGQSNPVNRQFPAPVLVSKHRWNAGLPWFLAARFLPPLPALSRSSLSGHPVFPPPLTACFHNAPQSAQMFWVFFFLPSLRVYSLILSAPVFLSPGCVLSVSTENIIPELFTLFFCIPVQTILS